MTTHYHLKPDLLDKQGCVKYDNDFAAQFNSELKKGVISARKKLSNATIIYVDVYAAKYELISKARQLGMLLKMIV